MISCQDETSKIGKKAAICTEKQVLVNSVLCHCVQILKSNKVSPLIYGGLLFYQPIKLVNVTFYFKFYNFMCIFN